MPTADLIPLGTHADFVLYERTARSTELWQNLKLVRVGDGTKKANWWAGWHRRDHRLSRNHDTGHLAEHHPEVMEWLVETLQQQTSSPGLDFLDAINRHAALDENKGDQ